MMMMQRYYSSLITIVTREGEETSIDEEGGMMPCKKRRRDGRDVLWHERVSSFFPRLAKVLLPLTFISLLETMHIHFLNSSLRVHLLLVHSVWEKESLVRRVRERMTE
jgi:hypothetical protein